MRALFRRLFREEEGQDLIEYALLGAIISIGSILAMQTVVGGITGTFTNISNQLPQGG